METTCFVHVASPSFHSRNRHAYISLPQPCTYYRNINSKSTRRQRGSTSLQSLNIRKEKRAQQGNKEPERRPGIKSLQGRFIPSVTSFETEMAELDTLHQTSVDPSTPFGGVLEEYDEFGLIREGLPIRDKESSSNKAKWNTKSEAAKRRWANPEYRQKILAKRRANMGEKQSIPNQKPKKVEIGNMDSVTLSSDQKSAEIIKYVRTNQLRSESLVRFRKDLSGWVENMLEDGEQKRKQLNNAQFKMERMKERSMRAREREMRKREHGASSDSGSDTADETVFVDKPTAQSTPFAAKTPLPRSAELVVEKKTSGHSKKTGPTEVTTRQSKSRLSRPTQTIAKARSAADSFGDVTDNSL